MDKTLKDIQDKIIAFKNARGWDPTAPDLAKSIVIEAAELLEHFQWDHTDLLQKRETPKDWQEIQYEVADVLWYLLEFCHRTNIDILKAFEKKYQHNSKKFPESAFNGKHNQQFYISQKKKYRAGKK